MVAVCPWRDRLVPCPRQGSGPVVWLPGGRKEVGSAELRSDRDSDAGPTGQEFPSWPALTWMPPGQTVPGAVE